MSVLHAHTHNLLCSHSNNVNFVQKNRNMPDFFTVNCQPTVYLSLHLHVKRSALRQYDSLVIHFHSPIDTLIHRRTTDEDVSVETDTADAEQ